MTHNYSVTQVPLSEIHYDEHFNCRGKVIAFDVIDLAKDIKINGLDTPISLQLWDKIPGKKYRILAGHRRFTAFRVNNEEFIPAFIVPISDENDARAYNLRENIFRQDLTLLQEAKALEKFFRDGWNTKQVASKLNRSPGWVEVRKQLCELPEPVQQEAHKGTINQSHIKGLYTLRSNPEKLFEALRKIKDQIQKGEKVTVKKDETLADLVKVKRPSPAEINEFLDTVFGCITSKIVGDYFPGRVGAWCAGNISKLEIYVSLKRECEKMGLIFNPPDEVKEAMKIYEKPSQTLTDSNVS